MSFYRVSYSFMLLAVFGFQSELSSAGHHEYGSFINQAVLIEPGKNSRKIEVFINRRSELILKISGDDIASEYHTLANQFFRILRSFFGGSDRRVLPDHIEHKHLPIIFALLSPFINIDRNTLQTADIVGDRINLTLLSSGFLYTLSLQGLIHDGHQIAISVVLYHHGGSVVNQFTVLFRAVVPRSSRSANGMRGQLVGLTGLLTLCVSAQTVEYTKR